MEDASLTWPRCPRLTCPCFARCRERPASPPRGPLRARIRTRNQSLRPGTRPPSARPGACGSRRQSRLPAGPVCPSRAAPGTPRGARAAPSDTSPDWEAHLAPGISTYLLLPRAAAMTATLQRAPHFRTQNALREARFLRPAGPAPGPALPAGSRVLPPRFPRHAGGRARSRPLPRAEPGVGTRAWSTHGFRTHPPSAGSQSLSTGQDGLLTICVLLVTPGGRPGLGPEYALPHSLPRAS